MKHIALGGSSLQGSEIGLGCMRLSGLNAAQAEELIQTALDEGINFFDHADIYGGGRSEELFAEVIGKHPHVRDKMILQSKCAIRRGYYDFSKEHILQSVDGILQRLKTDYLDVLLLHRPDSLMEPEEVAEAFEVLEHSGKVRNFGVSNHNPYQIALLQKYVKSKLLINQMQLSLTNCSMIDAGIHVNTESDNAVMRDGGILEYCRLHDITIQAWSPFQYGFFQGTFLGSDQYPELNAKLNEIAEEKGVSNSAIAIAWILRHPARIQPIVGTTNPKRLSEICKASDVSLSRQEWYALYKAAGKTLP